MSESYDTADSTSHVTSRKNYNWRGQTTFASYPAAGSPDLSALTTGTHTTYDSLGRTAEVDQDSAQGALSSTTAYLSGARKQVTDPNGNVTTTSYQVFDQPSYKQVIKVQAPEG
ncbi:MAG: wall associated protein, partial [Rhodanobacteraceae bacterium]